LYKIPCINDFSLLRLPLFNINGRLPIKGYRGGPGGKCFGILEFAYHQMQKITIKTLQRIRLNMLLLIPKIFGINVENSHHFTRDSGTKPEKPEL